MKFSFIEPHLRIYGGIRRIIELSNHLVKRNHQVTIYHPTGEPCDWLKCLAKTKKLEDIDKDRHEILVYNYPPQFKVFQTVPARLKVYYILHAHHLYYNKELIFRTYRQPGVLKIANSRWVASKVRYYLGESLPVVYGGINREIFHPVPGRKKEVDVMFYGSKRPWKGTETILEACKIGKFNFDYYEGKNLKQGQMADFISKGRVFVSGSWFEGWNNCTLEAMACGVPVVTTDCGGCNEFALDGITALVVPPKKPAVMAEKIKLLLTNDGLRRKIAAQGYKKSLEFNWDDCVRRWERTILEALGKRTL